MTEDCEAIRGRSPLAVILGSGLSELAARTDVIASIPYASIPGFGVTSVEGHPGQVVLSRIEGRPIILFAGRFHMYEGLGPAACAGPTALAAALGCSRLIATHAAGSLDRGLKPGSWMLPTGVVAFPSRFLLDLEVQIGSRHAGMDTPAGAERAAAERCPNDRSLVSERLRTEIGGAALEAGVPTAEGIVLWSPGPSYETAAEARAAALIGASAATMSSLPELVAARALGLEGALASWVTNYAVSLSTERIDHGEVCRLGPEGAASFGRILARLLDRLHDS